MFQVVSDVEKYPQFLPWVVALRVLSREHVKNRDVLSAEMAVGYGALREKYISRVILDRGAHTIDVAQTSGPFKQLENHWRFTPIGPGLSGRILARLRIPQPRAQRRRRRSVWKSLCEDGRRVRSAGERTLR